ncbi:carboxymuconolactone decarboxylase family protein [Pseudoalteromonas sp. MMG022]|uniref:carboxymuconolactone decarboxylase family protein n=1 Tax=Pseudoalteromonas sp. MMG022 TaxID=2909978 RepID=UPI001F2886CA|nr:carboxymuconolactone decarboxylase family protein [Pseudoalteromonas sp. MMG022]MCF6437709.1 carboxymuconolactone decarboxylase family protein [Pseudoalteromonas sp. MMG022]
MTSRINYFKIAPKAMDILLNQEQYLSNQFSSSETLSASLWELLKLRVSQINQCAFCIDMHSKVALERGEMPVRILGLNAWRGLPIYTHVERSALAWAELIVSDERVSQKEYELAVDVLTEPGLLDVTLAVNAINSWNRISKAFSPTIEKMSE